MDLPSSVFLVTHITQLFLMTAPTISGLFPSALSTRRFPLSLTFFPMWLCSLDAPLRAFSVIMGMSLITPPHDPFFLFKEVMLCMSCPYTSPQNGKAERIIHTTNNVIRTLLLHASMPPSYCVDALHTTTHVNNILPTKVLQSHTPHFALHGVHPTYTHLRIFGYACYP